MVKELFHIELDKLGQCADWRIRPIPKTMMNYAVRDSEHLLHAWDKVKRALLTRKMSLSSHVFSQSLQAVTTIYRFPKRKSYASIFDRLKSSGKRSFLGDLIPEGKEKFSKLCVLREGVARSSDHLETRVVPNEVLFDLLH